MRVPHDNRIVQVCHEVCPLQVYMPNKGWLCYECGSGSAFSGRHDGGKAARSSLRGCRPLKGTQSDSRLTQRLRAGLIPGVPSALAARLSFARVGAFGCERFRVLVSGGQQTAGCHVATLLAMTRERDGEVEALRAGREKMRDSSAANAFAFWAQEDKTGVPSALAAIGRGFTGFLSFEHPGVTMRR